MDSFFTDISFLQVGKTQDLPNKNWQTLGVARIVMVVVKYLYIWYLKMISFLILLKNL
jgi:hypothetical protein